MNKSRIQVVILAEIVPEHESSVLRVLKDIAMMTRQEEGCLRFDIYRDEAHPMRINTIEEWDSQDAIDRHMSTPYMKAAILRLVGKLTAIPEFRVLHPIDEMSP